MAKTFNFVNLTGLAQRNDAEYKRTVRSSAMRAWRQSERLQQVAEYRSQTLASQSTPTSASDQAASTPSSQSERSSDEEQLDRMSGLILKTSSSPGSGYLDPFMVSAIALPARYQELLWYFSTRIDVIMAPLGGCTYPNSWTHPLLKEAVSSPLLLMATCCHAATHESESTRRGSDLLTLRLRSATIELLNQSLQDESTRASDPAIAAVSLLVANTTTSADKPRGTKLISGDAEELIKHMRAMTEMANLRGGPQSLGLDGLLRRALSWHFAPTKILTQPTQPHKPLLKTPEHETGTTTTAAATACWDARLAALQPLIQQARRLTNQLDAAEPRLAHTMAAQMAFIDDRSALEISLVSLYDAWASADAHTGCAPAAHAALCLACALLIYTFRHLRTFTERAPTVRKLSADLVPALLLFAAHDLSAQLSRVQLEALLWTTVIELQVFPASGASYEFSCLTRLFRELAELLGLRDAEQVKVFLRRSVVWTEGAWTSRLDLVVNQIFTL